MSPPSGMPSVSYILRDTYGEWSVLVLVTSIPLPLQYMSPVTVRLSLTVVSEVVCPIEIGTPLVAVPIDTPLDVLEESMATAVVASTSNVPALTSTSAVSYTHLTLPTKA